MHYLLHSKSGMMWCPELALGIYGVGSVAKVVVFGDEADHRTD